MPRIYESIAYDYERSFGKPDTSHPMRSRIFDDAVIPWMKAHPGGTVVELGAGLETQFQRCDDGKVQWLCVDVREVDVVAYGPCAVCPVLLLRWPPPFRGCGLFPHALSNTKGNGVEERLSLEGKTLDLITHHMASGVDANIFFQTPHTFLLPPSTWPKAVFSIEKVRDAKQKPAICPILRN